jgi:hypothetical protein
MSDKQELVKIKTESLIKDDQGRQLIEIPLFFIKNIPSYSKNQDLVDLIKEYFNQVHLWISEYIQKVKKISKLYIVSLKEDDPIEKFLEINFKITETFYDFIIELSKNVDVIIVEDIDLYLEFLSWFDVITSQQASKFDLKLFNEVSQERLDHIAERIDKTLGENQVGVLFINPNSGINYSEDIKVIHFTPPIVDEIIKLYNKLVQSQ